jgi:hypothetical protein
MEAETYLQHTKTTTIKHYYNTFKYYTVSQVFMRKENQKGSNKKIIKKISISPTKTSKKQYILFYN